MTDGYVIFHLTTTCDDNGVYVTKDSSEAIEIAWIILDSKTLDEKHRGNLLIRPINTPITTLCTNLTTLTWEHVQNAGTFHNAITAFDRVLADLLLSKGMDFTFVCFNSWDLRVQLPREARDKSITLPGYLQYPKVFDLRLEYSKWQAHHPEAMTYNSLSLPAMSAALDVMDHKYLSIPKSRRALDEVVILSNLLRALVKKSLPVDKHPDVFSQPFDCKADIQAFLSERSKILHLANLPYDTTQSELESWFTQYGGRPIAFWTLRTPDQSSSAESGFAVFSTHEEALESLSMNGRALNERAVEVAPSGNAVLERARNILMPFPPSKNRPRPGDWTCPSCGFSNFQRRTACFRCSFVLLTQNAFTIQDPPLYSNSHHNDTFNNNNNSNSNNNINNNINNNNGNGNSNANAHRRITDHHHVQTNIEANDKNEQILDNHPRSQSISLDHRSISDHGKHNSNDHYGDNNNNNNNNGMRTNNTGGSVPFRAGDWKCGNEACNYHNFAKNVSCLRCGAPRVAGTGGMEPGRYSQYSFYNPQVPYHGASMTRPYSAQGLSGGVNVFRTQHNHQHQQQQQQQQQLYPIQSQPMNQSFTHQLMSPNVLNRASEASTLQGSFDSLSFSKSSGV